MSEPVSKQKGQSGWRRGLVLLSLAALVAAVGMSRQWLERFDPEPETEALRDAAGIDRTVPVPAPLMARTSVTGGSAHEFIRVTVTGYTSDPAQTDDTPFLTATCDPTRPGTLALSRDLLRTFTEGAPYDFGDRVLLPGMGIYVVEDTMHPRWRRRADIWFHDNETARQWGRREIYITRVDAEDPHLVAERWHPADWEIALPDPVGPPDSPEAN